MQLPGRLKATTLGDLLGVLHRGDASGTLELVETSGRAHRVHLAHGLVTAVEVDRAAASLGEILRDEEEVDDVTRESIKSFQRDHAIEVSGILDAVTAAQLEERHGH